jgi:hypothetical protein
MTDPTRDLESKAETPSTSDERVEANTALGTGLGIGAFGVASATLIGSVCPLCVVAAPALIGYGVYKRVQCARAERNAATEDEQENEQVGYQPRRQGS